jgi:hypothetical protein
VLNLALSLPTTTVSRSDEDYDDSAADDNNNLKMWERVFENVRGYRQFP